MSFDASVHAKATELVRAVILMTSEAKSGHPSSAASLAHLVTVLMYDHMRHDPSQPRRPGSDQLLLSEGHACPIVYAAAADLGIEIEDADGTRRPMTWADAMRLRAYDSAIDGHPNPVVGFPFFPAATGSLGQGLSIAAGIALAARLDGTDQRVFCLLGDGESREGQVGEALDFLLEHRLRAVLPIFNCNRLGQTGAVSDQQFPEKLAAKLQAFGFDAHIINGHDPTEIRSALDAHVRLADGDPPIAIVARTVKGWGIPLLQGEGHHGKAVDPDDVDQALEQLEQTARSLGAAWVPGYLEIPRVPDVPARSPAEQSDPPPLPGELREHGRHDALESRKLATRDAYGLALRALGHARADVVVLDGDVSNSTRAQDFAQTADLASRFFECRIAEQNMISCAAGLCAGDKRPFASTFGKFMARGYDQIEMALLGGFPLSLVGSHVGVTPAADGPSQMAMTDAGYFHSLSTVTGHDGKPLIHVLTPADAFAAYALTFAMANHDGACYLRTMRPTVPFLYDENDRFEIGGHRVLRQGRDLLVAAWGYCVHEALDAAEQLASDGIDAAVVDLYSIPFDRHVLAGYAQACGGRVLTVEDNYGGGLGSAVADAMSAHATERVEVQQMFVRRLPKSARTHDEELERLCLSAEHIAANGRRMVRGA